MKRIILTLPIFLLLTSCILLPPSNSAELSLGYSPNPSYDCYYDASRGWTWEVDVEIEEKGGISVTLGNNSPAGYCCTSDFYSGGSLVYSDGYYSDDVESWFGTLYIPANGSIIQTNANFWYGNYTEGYVVETYYGEDENGNTVSCSNTLYLENPNKGSR
ncbi:MAG: hypothetical protein PHW02_02795 [bacterium]|nr:hypothetical protein [bacterium]